MGFPVPTFRCRAATGHRRAWPLAFATGMLVGTVVPSIAEAEQGEALDDPAKRQCVESYTEAQKLRRAGKLLAAHEELVRCSQAICPSVVQRDCVPWLAEVEASTPSVVVAAKGRDGRDTTNVRVLVDGAPVVESLTGRPIELDPGPHQLRFEHPGADPIERAIVLQESTKDRRIEVSFAPQATEPVPPGSSPPPGPRSSGTQGDQPPDPAVAVAGYVLTGVGVVGLGAFAVLGLVGKAEADDYEETCGPTRSCDEDDVDATRSKLIAADVSLIVGIAALGVGIGLIVWDELSDEEDAPSSARIELRPTAGGASGSLRVAF